MGLDMYLFKCSKERTEIAYWRKANQIRDWFVRHGYPENGNCMDYYLEKEDLEQLVRDCKAVLDNHDLAEELMPTSDGFFFGGTDYDEWYFKDLENTIEQVEKVIKETDWDNELVYYYEWW